MSDFYKTGVPGPGDIGITGVRIEDIHTFILQLNNDLTWLNYYSKDDFNSIKAELKDEIKSLMDNLVKKI